MSVESKAYASAIAMAQPHGRLIVLAATGSRAYGTDHEGSDYDFKGVYVAPLDSVLSVSSQPPKTLTQSEPYDITLYELSHFCKLALAANPTVLEILWADDMVNMRSSTILHGIKRSFLSKRVVQTYGGYAQAQLKKAEQGSGGSRGHGQYVRPKFKLHTLRLLDAGIYALREGAIQVKVSNPGALLRQAETLSLDELKQLVVQEYALMKRLATTSELPDEPDFATVDEAVRAIRLAGVR